MSHRAAAALALAALLGVAAPAVAKDLAKRPAGEASKIATIAPSDAGGELRWPLPAAAGRVLEYDQRVVRERTRAQVRSRMVSSAVLDIRPGPPREGGYEQHWSSREERVEVEGPQAAEQRALLEAATRLFGGQVLRVRLDADGAATGVEDVAEVFAPRFRQLMEEAMTRSGGDPAALRPLLDGMSRVEVVEGLLLQLPATLYFPGGGGVPVGEGIEYRDEAPNPFGGKPFPMLGRIEAAPGARPGEIDMTWTLTVDPVAGAPILWDVVGTLVGKELVDSVRDQLPDEIHFETVTRYRIDAGTGVVRWLEQVETRRVMDNVDTTRTTLELREARPAASP